MDKDLNMEKLFGDRYRDSAFWIINKLHTGTKGGVIDLLFWRLPLIFIEGKIIAAFFEKDSSERPLLDTISIPIDSSDGREKELFPYRSFIASTTDDGEHFLYPIKDDLITFSTVRRKTDGNKFTFLDYFGIPCLTSRDVKEYSCFFFRFPFLRGKIEIWVVTETSLLTKKQSFANYHKKNLIVLLSRLKDSLKKGKEDHLVGFFYKHAEKYDPRRDNYKIKMSDYLVSTLTNLHDALLEYMQWSDDPTRIFILTSANRYSYAMRFFLTRRQQEDYQHKFKNLEDDQKKEIVHKIITVLRKKVASFLNPIVAVDIYKQAKLTGEDVERIKEDVRRGITENRLKQVYEVIGQNYPDEIIQMIYGNLDNYDRQSFHQNLKALADDIFDKLAHYEEELNSSNGKRLLESDMALAEAFVRLTDYPQSGTISSLHKVKGFYDIFLFSETIPFDHYPILHKRAVIENHLGSEFVYDENLMALEKIFLVDLPRRSDNLNFVMIPFFFMDACIGCIAFFIPKVTRGNSAETAIGYKELQRILSIIENYEDKIYQAAVRDLCHEILVTIEGDNG